MEAKDISSMLGKHYSQKFAQYGDTPLGVDWGADHADHLIRLERMLAVTNVGRQPDTVQSILDVGCGYGRLYELCKSRSLNFSYSGIDICEEMIVSAKNKFAVGEWFVGDVLGLEESRQFDYVVCNGILTQKLNASIREMDEYLKLLVSKMFALCRIGIAFNLMTTHVNFTAPNLYYRNPAELLGWCMSQLTSRVRLDHAYPLYEYTVYLYREDAPGVVYGSHRQS